MSSNLPEATTKVYQDYVRLSEKVFMYMILNLGMSFCFTPVVWLKDDYRTLALMYLVIISMLSIVCCYKLCVYMYRSWDLRRQYDFG